MGALTSKQKRFCNEYLVDHNAKRAAIASGYSVLEGRSLLKAPAVKKFISKEPVDEGGRPTKYQPSFNKQAERFAKLGLIDKDMAEAFGIDVATFNRWKERFPKFRDSLNAGKEIADAMVGEKLFQRATGYSCPDVDIKVIEGMIVQTKLIKHYPPDTAAAIFWLKNRQKHRWRDKIEHGLTDGDGNDVNPVYVFKLPDNGRDNQAAGS